MPLSSAETRSIVHALELIPRRTSVWDGTRHGVPVELDARWFHTELVAPIQGPLPPGLVIRGRGLFRHPWEDSIRVQEAARITGAEAKDADRIYGDETLEAILGEFLALPGAWIGEGAVHVRPSADLETTRRAADLAVRIAARLSTLFAPDADRFAVKDEPVEKASTLELFNRGMHVFLDLCFSVLNLVPWTRGDGYGSGGVWVARLCGVALLFGMLGIDLSRKRTALRKTSVAVFVASCMLSGLVATCEGGRSAAWFPVAVAVMFGASQLMKLM